MGIFDDKPDITIISEIADHYMSVWSKTHELFRKADSYYWQEWDIWNSKFPQRPVFRPPTARSVVDGGSQIFMPFEPRFRRSPLTENSQEAQKSADAIEQGLSSVFLDSSLMETLLPFKVAGKNMGLYGYTSIEGPVLDLAEEPEEIERKKGQSDGEWEQRQREHDSLSKGWNPFRIHCYNPARVLMDPYEKRPSIAVKRDWRYSYELEELTKKKRAGEARNERESTLWEVSGKPLDQVPVLEFWSPSWHAMVAIRGKLLVGARYAQGNSEMLFVEKNTYGFVPFTQAFAGWGMERTDIENMDPQWLASGVLQGLFETLTIEAQDATARHQMMQIAAWIRIGSAYPPDEAQQLLSGDFVLPGKQDDWWYMSMPNLPQWMFAEGATVANYIEKGSYAQSLLGIRQAGVSTVGQEAILSHAAQLKFVAPQRQMDYMASVIASNVLRLIYKLDKTFHIRGSRIRPDDIRGNYYVDANFELLDPVLHLQELQHALNEVREGLLSDTTYWEKARLSNVSRERDRLLDMELRRMPAVKMAQLEEYLQAVGKTGLLARMKAFSATDGGAEVPPEMPGMPEEMGEEISASPMGEPTASPPEPGGMREAALAARQLRQPLTGRVAKPGLRR